MLDPNLHVIGQDYDDGDEDFEEEMEEDPSESDLELELDINPEYESKSIPPFYSSTYPAPDTDSFSTFLPALSISKRK